jgi:hypothetical protein
LLPHSRTIAIERSLMDFQTGTIQRLGISDLNGNRKVLNYEMLEYHPSAIDSEKLFIYFCVINQRFEYLILLILSKSQSRVTEARQT